MAGTQIVRRGECNHCGWCCQFMSILRVTVPARDVTEDSTRFYQMRHAVKHADGTLRFVSHQFLPCSEHDNDKKRCRIYEKRPDICRVFPQTPDQIEGTPCSHWFELVNDKGEVIEQRGGLGSPHSSPPRFRDVPSSFARADPEAEPVQPEEMWPAVK